ncbi:MAG: hypothetical protein U0556_02710 [Dehalococcoidia bacterium]
MARLISAKDIEAAAASGQRSVSYGSGQIVTPAAKDRARELGITITNGAGGGMPATAPANGPAAFVPVAQPAAPSPAASMPSPASQLPAFIPPSGPVAQDPSTLRARGAGTTGITQLQVRVEDKDNPTYFESPVIDNLFNITLELGAAIWVVKDRVRVLEEMLEQKGVVSAEQIERYRTPADREREIRAKRDQFIEKIYKSIRDNPG